MTETDIEWGYNCLTDGVHHGRPEAIWNIPLGYAKQIYGDIVLREMEVTGRIKREELNRGYAPLHGHDTINMLCRIIGMSARGRAER
jgi:hypothetical protein